MLLGLTRNGLDAANDDVTLADVLSQSRWDVHNKRVSNYSASSVLRAKTSRLQTRHARAMFCSKDTLSNNM